MGGMVPGQLQLLLYMPDYLDLFQFDSRSGSDQKLP